MSTAASPLQDAPGTRIDPASFAQLARIVRDEAGIVLNDTKRSLVVSRLSRRLRVLGLPDFAAYCRHVEAPSGSEERRELISLLTTNVTRFFREVHHFDYLEREVLPGLLRDARAGRRVRIWSAGCSSGQEPYSIAMTILKLMPEAGQHDIRILGTDIDPRMIAMGREALYPVPDAGDVPRQTVETFFEQAPDRPGHCRVGAAARALVQLAELNLMQDWPMRGKFDVIFCRNTVIYFDAATQARLWGRFADQLHPNGHLFIGHSERVSGPAEAHFKTTGVTQYQRR